MNIIKRDNSNAVFEKGKVYDAIMRAMRFGSGIIKPDIAQEIADEIEQEAETIENLTVYIIESLVFNKLCEKGETQTARSYEGYRSVREFQRDVKNSTDNDIMELLLGKSEYWNNENSNKNAMLVTTQRDYMAGISSEDITKRFLLTPDIIQAHNEGILHFHDADYFAQKTLYNCFSGDTKFVTDTGVHKFTDFYDGDKVRVQDKNGKWRDATIRCYGKQEMFDVVFKNQLTSQTVTCTRNHRWILKDGTVTTSLKVGDVIYPLNNRSKEYSSYSDDYDRYFALGFVLGDGVDYRDNGKYIGVKVRLCGDKVSYKNVFERAGYNFGNIEKDIYAYNKKEYSKQDFLNSNSWRLLPLTARVALFHGFYAADGAKNSNRLSTTDERIERFIEENSALAGYYISSRKEVYRDTNYKKNARLVTYRFMTSQSINQCFKVESITPHHNYSYKSRNFQEEVNTKINAWCVEEPVTHTFTLANGIVTGNCCLINLEDMLQNGTVISGVMIEKPHSFATACNIATQIIAQVASSQYGGQTISLTHLAPFVEVSRQKIRKQVVKELDGIPVSSQKINEIVETRVRDEINRGVQTIQYQVVTLMTTNG